MDDLNLLYDFINSECDKLYDKLVDDGVLPLVGGLTETDKRRDAFYFYILKNLNDADYKETFEKFLFDNAFLLRYKGKEYDFKDFGIDACFISYEKKTVYFYNFKFRSALEDEQSSSELRSCKDFFDKLLKSDDVDLGGQIKVTYERLKEISNEPKKWTYVLNYVSNEKKSVKKDDSIVKEFKRLYKVRVNGYSLTELSKRLSTKPNSINCKFALPSVDIINVKVLNNDSLICRMRVLDVFRIFCEDKDSRNDHEMRDYAPIKNKKIDEAALFDNPRGDLEDKKFIEAISRTLIDNPEMFFAYNNGITVLANKIELDEDSSFAGQNKFYSLTDAQIVNGGQTIRACAKAINTAQNLDNIKKANVLVRIFNIEEQDNLDDRQKETNRSSFRKIPEFTNKQVKISDIDLKAMDYIQILIERKLAEHRIFYCRRNQKNHRFDTTKFDSMITMEKFGQVLFSAVNGNPHQASQKKKAIFSTAYNSVFNSSLDIDKCYVYANDFNNISSQYHLSQQKVFYVIYIKSKLNSFNGYDNCIQILDGCLRDFVKYDTDVVMKDSRKLILEEFKTNLDTKIESINNPTAIETVDDTGEGE